MNFSRFLETPRLVLRPLLLSDEPFFASLLSSKQVRQYLGGPVPISDRESRFQSYLSSPDDVGVWVAEVRQTSDPVGVVVLNPHQDGRDYEISYQFHPSQWGNGFASEASACVVQHALNDTRMVRVIAETQSANAASCSLLEAIGMKEQMRLHRFEAEQIIYATGPDS